MINTNMALWVGVLLGTCASACAVDTSSSQADGGHENAAEATLALSADSTSDDTCGAWTHALVDDLEDGDVFFGPRDQGTWLVFNDQSGKQLPAMVDDLVVRGGPRGSRFVAHSTGSGFTSWGAGLGLALARRARPEYDGVRFKVKAGGMGTFATEVVTLALLPQEFGGRCEGDGCNDYHRAPITLPNDRYYECTVPFASLVQQGWARQLCWI